MFKISRPKTSPKSQPTAKSGFTMVEVMIAMAFVSVLLITIAIVTTNIVAIYQKGLTLKAVNSVGRGLVDELTASINTAPSVDTTSLCHSLAPGNVNKCVKDHAFGFIFHASQNSQGQQLNGVFCTGHYSYIWNTYYGEQEGRTIKLLYRNTSNQDVTTEPPRLMKLEDRTHRVCSAVMNSDYSTNFSANMTIDIRTLAGSSASDTNPLWNRIPTPEQGMLNQFDLDLMLYEFTIFPISQDAVTLRTYMSGTFVLATLRGNVDIMRSGDYCQPDRVTDPTTGEVIEGDTSSLNDLGSEFNYCAINKFNFAARTAGV